MERLTVAPELLAAAVAGDGRARDRIVSAWLPEVLRWCARLGGPRVDPEDVAHEVFLVFLRKLPGLGDVEAFGPWLYQVTRRVLAQHRRRVWFARWAGSLGLEALADDDPAWARGDVARRVLRALDALSADHREVLVLCDVEQYTDLEVAALTGVPVGTVKSRLRVARERFRRAATRQGLAPDLVAVAEEAR